MRKSRLSQEKQGRLIKYFAAGVAARITAELVGVNRNAASLYVYRLRQLICQTIDEASPLSGEIEADELYFAKGNEAVVLLARFQFRHFETCGQVYQKKMVVRN